jgi:hypothetical protein
MKQLVSTYSFETILQILMYVTLVAGVAIGVVAGLLCKRHRAHCIALGLMLGISGMAVFGLWRIFHALGSHSGFTSLGFIGGQMVLFVGIGLAAGAVFQKTIDASSRRMASLEQAKINQEDKLNA